MTGKLTPLLSISTCGSYYTPIIWYINIADIVRNCQNTGTRSLVIFVVTSKTRRSQVLGSVPILDAWVGAGQPSLYTNATHWWRAEEARPVTFARSARAVSGPKCIVGYIYTLYIFISKNRASCMTRWACSACQWSTNCLCEHYM